MERNLHDGAQQELVAAIASIGTVDATNATGVDLAARTAELRRMLTDARISMLELCGDGRPPPLVELGLAGALGRLADLAAQSGVTTTVEVTESPLPPEIEAAAYFCCSEALQNVAKYAHATTATVSVRLTGDEVDLSITDNGRGFDPAAADQAGGLAALQDRLAGLGGRSDGLVRARARHHAAGDDSGAGMNRYLAMTTETRRFLAVTTARLAIAAYPVRRRRGRLRRHRRAAGVGCGGGNQRRRVHPLGDARMGGANRNPRCPGIAGGQLPDGP